MLILAELTITIRWKQDYKSYSFILNSFTCPFLFFSLLYYCSYLVTHFSYSAFVTVCNIISHFCVNRSAYVTAAVLYCTRYYMLLLIIWYKYDKCNRLHVAIHKLVLLHYIYLKINKLFYNSRFEYIIRFLISQIITTYYYIIKKV